MACSVPILAIAVALVGTSAGCTNKDAPASTIRIEVGANPADVDPTTVQFFRGSQPLTETHERRDAFVIYHVTVPVPAKEWLQTDLRYEAASVCGTLTYQISVDLFPGGSGNERLTHEGELQFRLDGAKTELNCSAVAPWTTSSASPQPNHDLTLDVFVDNRGGTAGRLRTVESGFETAAADVAPDSTSEVKLQPARCGKPITFFLGTTSLGSLAQDPKPQGDAGVPVLADLQGKRCYRLFEHTYHLEGPGPKRTTTESNEPVYLRGSQLMTLPKPPDDAFKPSPDSLTSSSIVRERLELLPWDCTKSPKGTGTP